MSISNDNQASNESDGDRNEDFGSNGVDYSHHFTTDKIFTSSKEGFNWTYNTALGLGFGIKRESNKKRGRKTDLRADYFVCRRGGRRPKNDDADTLMRANTSFQWCDCKFKMKLVEVQREPPMWLLYMGQVGVHNHSMVTYCDGDRYYAKLDDEELAYIDAQVAAHVPPAMISAGLHNRNPEKSRPTRRQIYNRSQKVRAEEREGRNPAQQMLALAVQHKYVHFWVTDQSTHKLTHVFMAHPEAVKMFRSYYYVVLMDSTYKTNLYGLPLIEMIVTPVGKSFVIAYAFVTHESEDVLDLYGFATMYNWVICVVSSFLDQQGARHWGTSNTYMPLRALHGVRTPYGDLWVLHAGNHYMRIRVRPLSPMPPIAPFLVHDGTVSHYRSMYQHQFSTWESFEPRHG